ncbi:MAG TPA: sigma 54-interacting transcriptional regulator [Pseudomonadota bacterium]|nr:sigma 54-interacting transcriptional regulator [Pseudomonadota bacterium]
MARTPQSPQGLFSPTPSPCATHTLHELDGTAQEASGAAVSRGYLLIIEAGSSLAVDLPAQGTLILGRAPEVEVPLRSLAVSRRHAQLTVGPDGVRATDLGSHNGTRHNGERLTEPRALYPGDVLTLCDVAVVYYGPSGPAAGGRLRPLGTDPGLFRQQLAIEIERGARSLRSVAVVVVRAPQFGGSDLGELAAVLGGFLRRMDHATLAGRDELWVLLPELSEDEATEVAQRLLLALRALAPAARAAWAVTTVDGFNGDALLAGASIAAEGAGEGQVRAAGEAVTRVRVGEIDVLLADPAMLRLYGLVERLAASELPVLVSGETGTGKELVAQALHERSPRRSGPLISINCAALPESLAESELFGHEKGAFTGATASKMGLLEAANGGSVFFDELGELPLSIQAKLLRVLETKRLVRVGDTRERQIDFRLVAATNRKLQEEALQGRFRQDLYFRLSTAVLVLPPLRDRKRELALLARAFLSAACAQLGKPAMMLSPAALEQLGRYAWPGNVRELRNAMQFAAATATESVLAPWHLPEQIGTAAPNLPANLPPQALQSLHEIAASTLRLPVGDKLAAVEAAVVAAALKQAGGNKSQAARLLGVHRKSIERKTR